MKTEINTVSSGSHWLQRELRIIARHGFNKEATINVVGWHCPRRQASNRVILEVVHRDTEEYPHRKIMDTELTPEQAFELASRLLQAATFAISGKNIIKE